MQQPKEILPEGRVDQQPPEKVEKLPGTETLAVNALPNTVPFSAMVLEQGNKAEQHALPPLREDGISGTNAKAGQQAGVGVGVGVGTNFSNIDDLLAGTATLTQETAPILMATDLLFEYDSDTLRKEASESLLKLGALIRRNAQASFRIEGHTDSFGSEAYNDQLSLRRAEAVKTWLLQNAGLDIRHMTTAGLGKRHLLAPSTGSVTEQQINRRVEIVITTH
jgi:outer membrane protein OmpA-like peptidoglycan-associated protein